ncbi:DUF3613 domain-containing protein [Stenotrophomonas sp. CC22-02]|uniref:DUF3613 domain-containing protein n=1 Tax=Stenotrophomonas sp. CC22-02 TaxID=1378087 RepID=UPI001062E674|nr:DUF3613 domain-containing protein [Stenotrophomonas sp. CC22-02]TDV31108.1 uncharacterized protein DUF3613 [Stenotrophomonas sp. CC22-02]
MIKPLLTRRLLPALSGLLLATAAQAQQQPLTGQMLGGARPAATAAQPLQSETLATVDVSAPEARVPVPAPASPPAYDLASTAAAPAPAVRRSEIGDATRSLFQLQASGQQAGARLPILGDQATLSYARYLKSFQHEIPDFFETDVGKSKGTSSSGR